jgi:hypothetical protein
LAHIKTTYLPDGTKKREPVGYGGGLCNEATAPYERRELGGKKTPTAEADQPPAVAETVAGKTKLQG